jgi:hypothetical protein
MSRATFGYCCSQGWIPDAGCKFSVTRSPCLWTHDMNASGSGK